MLWDAGDAALQAAAEPTYRRIQEDQARVPPQVAPLLRTLQEDLFDPDLTVGELRRRARIRNNSIPVLFRQHLGLTLSEYLADLRLEVGARLLRKTELPVWRIASLLGFSGLPVFSRSFSRWSGGSAPRAYRAALGKAAVREMRDTWEGAAFIRRALRGELSEDEAVPMLAYLQGLYSEFVRQPASVPPVKRHIDGGEYEASEAERIWQSLQGRAHAEQISIVRDQYCFSTPVLFDLLRRKSREIGRVDRARGLELAELARESLLGSAQTLRGDLSDLMALAWAWIGNARRLALDFAGAGKAFQEARHEWERSGRRNTVNRAETAYLEASLRINQREHTRAETLLESAIATLREHGVGRQLVEALVMRATVHGRVGRPADAIVDLHEAREMLESAGHTDRYLGVVLELHLAISYVYAGKLSAAAATIPRIRSLCRALGNRLLQAQAIWTEGLTHAGRGRHAKAEAALVDARRRFLEQGEPGHAAVVAVDLAMIYVERDRLREALEALREALPILNAFRTHYEGIVAFSLVSKILETEEVTLDALREARKRLQHVQGEPTAQLALETCELKVDQS